MKKNTAINLIVFALLLLIVGASAAYWSNRPTPVVMLEVDAAIAWMHAIEQGDRETIEAIICPNVDKDYALDQLGNIDDILSDIQSAKFVQFDNRGQEHPTITILVVTNQPYRNKDSNTAVIELDRHYLCVNTFFLDAAAFIGIR